MTTQTRAHAEGRHDAPRRLPVRARRRLARRAALRQEEDLRAPPPSLRVQQRLPRAARGARPASLRAVARRRRWSRWSSSPTTRGSSAASSTPSSSRGRSTAIRSSGLHPRGARSSAARAPRGAAAAAALKVVEARSDATRASRVGPVAIGGGAPLALIAGPCVIESRDSRAAPRRAAARRGARASACRSSTSASFDKANRTSRRGRSAARAWTTGCAILAEVRREIGVPVLTDVHEAAQVAGRSPRSSTCCRRRRFSAGRPTFIVAVAAAGKPVNVKKGQFLSPAGDGARGREGARRPATTSVLVTERGFELRLQQSRRRHALARDHARDSATRWSSTPRTACSCPGGAGTASGGEREFVPPLARAAVAVGVDARLHGGARGSRSRSQRRPELTGLLDRLEPLLRELKSVDEVVKARVKKATGVAAARPARRRRSTAVERARRVLDDRGRRRCAALADRARRGASSAPSSCWPRRGGKVVVTGIGKSGHRRAARSPRRSPAPARRRSSCTPARACTATSACSCAATRCSRSRTAARPREILACCRSCKRLRPPAHRADRRARARRWPRAPTSCST